MPTVEILECKGCGHPLAPKVTVCGYCGNEHIIKSDKSPFSLPDKLVKKYANHYKSKVQNDPKDGEAVFSLGTFYLKLKLYDLAVKNCKFLIVEMSNGQMVEDVRLTAQGKTTVDLYNRMGGVVPTTEEIIEHIQNRFSLNN